MKQEVVAFLSSRAGLLASASLFLALGVVTFVGTWRRLRPTRVPDHGRRSRGRRRQTKGQTSTRGGRAVASILAAGLITGCLILPLTFTIALEDVFALPKTVVLRSLALAAGILLALAAINGTRPATIRTVDMATAAYASFGIAATAMSVDPGLSLSGERYQYQGLLSILAYVALFVGARFSLVESSHVRLLAAAIVMSAVVVAVYAVAQWVGLDPIWSELYKGRVFSTVGQANALASVLAMAMVMALALVAGTERRGQAVLVGAVAVIGAAFVLTFSRGGYVAFALAIVASLLVLLPGASWVVVRSYLPRVGIALGVAGLLLLGAAMTWRPAGELLGEITGRAASIADPGESSNRSHVDLWAVGLRIAADHPLFGTGPDTYVVVFPEYRDRVLPEERAALMARFRPESPHDVYIAIAAGQGLPALAAYLTIIAGSLGLGARAARSAMPATSRLALAALTGAVVVHLVTDSFMTAEPASTAIFWVVLGSLAGLADTTLSADATSAASR